MALEGAIGYEVVDSQVIVRVDEPPGADDRVAGKGGTGVIAGEGGGGTVGNGSAVGNGGAVGMGAMVGALVSLLNPYVCPETAIIISTRGDEKRSFHRPPYGLFAHYPFGLSVTREVFPGLKSP